MNRRATAAAKAAAEKPNATTTATTTAATADAGSTKDAGNQVATDAKLPDAQRQDADAGAGKSLPEDSDAGAGQGAAAAETDLKATTSTSTSAITTATADGASSAVIGPIAEANAEALEALLTGLRLPVLLKVTNRMPRRIHFPQIKGFALGNAAGAMEARSAVVAVHEEGALHRVVVDIQALCKLNGYAEGVVLAIHDQAD